MKVKETHQLVWYSMGNLSSKVHQCAVACPFALLLTFALLQPALPPRLCNENQSLKPATGCFWVKLIFSFKDLVKI